MKVQQVCKLEGPVRQYRCKNAEEDREWRVKLSGEDRSIGEDCVACAEILI